MSRIVPLSLGISLLELQNNVFTEFFGHFPGDTSAALSYWPPNTKELATGLTPLRVLLTNDGVIGYFFKHLNVHKAMNLFVKFEEGTKEPVGSVVFNNDNGYTTPTPLLKKHDFLGEVGGLTKHDTDSKEGCGYALTTGSKIKPFLLDDDTLIEHIEVEEKIIRSESRHAKDSLLSNDGEETLSDEEVPREINEDEVRPCGYDHEFWGTIVRRRLFRFKRSIYYGWVS